MNNFLDVALSCVRRGWFVHPLAPRDKVPITPHGKNDATRDEAQIQAWWKDKKSNVGISCAPSELCVLDADHGLASMEDFIAWRDRNGLPVTYAVRSGRRPEFGVQSYYAGCLKDGKFELDGVSGDIKSAGGLVLAAGSVHPSGETYTVIVDAPLAAVPVDHIERSRVKPINLADGDAPIRENRNMALTSIAGKLRNAGLSPAALEAALLQVNADRCEPTLEEEEVKQIAASVGRYALPEPDVKVKIGREAPEPANLAERVRPVYPISAWDGTIVAEFAELCSHDNNVPKKMYAESFRCVLGAVVGDRLTCPGVEGALPRTYTIIVAPKGKGKGTAIRRAVRFFNQDWSGGVLPVSKGLSVSVTGGLLSGERDFLWKPRGVGAWMAAASSVPGMARLCRDLDSTIKNKPQLTWGNTLPRILSEHEEMKTFLSTLFIEGGVGSGMEGVVCQLWDDISFHGTATGTRDAVYGELMFSMLCGITEEDWFDLLSRGNAVGSGLMSRFNIIGTEGNYENVSKLHPPDFTPLQERFLPRVLQLEDTYARIAPSQAAENIISEWTENLPDGSERMNIHAWRSALLIAWLRHENIISAQTAQDAVSLGQYQIASHEYYRTKSADSAIAKIQAQILRVLEMKGAMTKRGLQRATHADRVGTEMWTRGLEGLIRDSSVGRREDGTLYLAN
jgi:hypothetical protein